MSNQILNLATGIKIMDLLMLSTAFDPNCLCSQVLCSQWPELITAYAPNGLHSQQPMLPSAYALNGLNSKWSPIAPSGKNSIPNILQLPIIS